MKSTLAGVLTLSVLTFAVCGHPADPSFDTVVPVADDGCPDPNNDGEDIGEDDGCPEPIEVFAR